ncbi:MAG: hypothetical protein IPO58_24870 [Betaproteobacteria bacterium]|nr:hypothetical protein [Betaproteobacteria bacterium]
MPARPAAPSPSPGPPSPSTSPSLRARRPVRYRRARTVAEKLRPTAWPAGRSRTGGARRPSADFVAKSPADGYTHPGPAPALFPITQYACPKPPYDSRKDFTPVTLLVTNPMVVTVNANVPAKNPCGVRS